MVRFDLKLLGTWKLEFDQKIGILNEKFFKDELVVYK